ncbi:hypothetical protein JAAARDRAFT_38040 [Jaapia argillacea MUCL 33604]|uniref:Ras GEF n=1 Tax=Jaapia argillacea MUCL 33604 TaxID=933084 RepID=A0A067PUJ2_9AGAM|nr:hypothetical protein JAAARDRAFT_38040 [Jaapia argillacea MUCL 33604]
MHTDFRSFQTYIRKLSPLDSFSNNNSSSPVDGGSDAGYDSGHSTASVPMRTRSRVMSHIGPSPSPAMDKERSDSPGKPGARARKSSLLGRARPKSIPRAPPRSLSSSFSFIGTSPGMNKVIGVSGESFDGSLSAMYPPLKISLLVIGSGGCGKSTLIRNGLKSCGLSDPAFLSIPLRSVGSFNYAFYAGRIPSNESGHKGTVAVMEVDISTFAVDEGPSSGFSWPLDAPAIDGVIICYDASQRTPLEPIEPLLRGFQHSKIPTIVGALKSDLECPVDPRECMLALQPYDARLVECTTAGDAGLARMTLCFDWLLNAVLSRHPKAPGNRPESRTPPKVLTYPTPRRGWSTAPVSPVAGVTIHPDSRLETLIEKSKNPSSFLSSPLSRRATSPSDVPPRAWSASDLLSLHRKSEKSKSVSGTVRASSLSRNMASSAPSPPTLEDHMEHVNLDVPPPPPEKGRDAQPSPWATLDQLLDKLLFLAVSGDDPAYISHFLLTYRRFAVPRSLLLAMQKRMHQLEEPSWDPMLASFAQMRICHLLSQWIKEYPGDFAVRGTAGALSALVKSIVGKTHLLYHACDLLPFVDLLSTLRDPDSAWTLKFDDPIDESDDSYSYTDEDLEPMVFPSETSSTRTGSSENKKSNRSTSPNPDDNHARVPLIVKAMVMADIPLSDTFDRQKCQVLSEKQIIKELHRMSLDLGAWESKHIAEEITRISAKLFLQIEPRHWLKHIYISGHKDPETDTVARFNQVSEHLAEWVVSLILCHDKPRARARQIEKFIDICTWLRQLHNYSALRAIVAGINDSTFPGDATSDILKKSSTRLKSLQSYDLLFQQRRSHRSYRMALKNTAGACIPALEVHLSDLIRTHEGNPDLHADDNTKIHWGKFTLLGKFVSTITQCQTQCRQSGNYNFTQRPQILNILMKECLMDEKMQRSRIAPAPDVGDYQSSSYNPRRISQEFVSNIPGDPSLVRKMFFW